MAGKRYEYAAVKVIPDQSPVADLNKLGTNGYRIAATVGQLLLLERKVKEEDNDDEEEAS